MIGENLGKTSLSSQIFLAGTPIPIIDVCTGGPPDEVTALPHSLNAKKLVPKRQRLDAISSLYQDNVAVIQAFYEVALEIAEGNNCILLEKQL